MKRKLIVLLFLFAFLERTIWDLGPNIEIVTTAVILSSYYLGGKNSLVLTLIIVAVSDLIIGNTNIFLFTWTGFLIPALLASNLITKLLAKIRFELIPLTIVGITANLFFFIWTNFGVWFLDSWGMYPNNPNGLIKCYLNALPFLKNQITSSVIFIPVGFFVIEVILRISKYFKLQPGMVRKSLL